MCRWSESEEDGSPASGYQLTVAATAAHSETVKVRHSSRAQLQYFFNTKFELDSVGLPEDIISDVHHK